ncbi:NAD(P)-dependent alcohol dehydrogenase [Streptomyces sp. NPDC002514]|uniref:NAD(P)-dependent alcohol dehydrogenase n=1 Tax=unclassified Streptomyces TaxID=2593676 RepID=UPI0036B00049
MRIRAAVLRDPAKPFAVEDVDLHEPGPGEALVRVVGAGMCHTDVTVRRRPHLPMPMIFGHEGSGVVEAVGPGVTRVRPGDHVVMSFDSCGWCAQCHTGAPAYCAQFMARNVSGARVDGSSGATDLTGAPVAARWFGQSSFATHAVATERNLVVVDPALPLDLLGPLGCGLQTGAGAVLNSLSVRPGDGVAVFGTGAVGLAAVMAAKVAGAADIVAVDLHPGRRALAAELGATRVLDGADPDLAAAVGPVDHSFDTTAVAAVMTTAVTVLRPGGCCALVGAGGDELTLRPSALAGRSLRFVIEGDAVPQRFVPRLIDLWRQGRFPFERLVRTYPLDDIATAERESADGTTVKPVLLPHHP